MLTQSALAAQVCVVWQTVSDWERGENMPLGLHLSALANIFGVTAGTLLNELNAWRARD